ncbi:MAG: T9SS type A sorting domain-containing protein [Lewinellaceae bacterium]|nr:T9SS type A sorting domain-containing protein [Lewinellaceae bacterium]
MQWSWITANAFTDVRYGVQTESENPDLQIRCNGFEGFDLAMEDGKFTEAAAYIEQIGEAEQPSKAYMEKVYAIRLDGRGPGALTPEEKEEIIVEHGDDPPCGAPFGDYLEYKKDNPDTEPEIVIAPNGESIEGWPAVGDIAASANPSSELLLYPNPSTGLLTAQWQQEGPVELKIFTTAGHQAWAYQGASEGPISINLSHLPPGLSLLTFRTENGLLSRKILLSN